MSFQSTTLATVVQTPLLPQGTPISSGTPTFGQDPSTVTEAEPVQTTLAPEELDVLSLIERVGSVFSLIGCLFIIGTFCSSKAFHKPINRLVFYASFGNMMTNVGTLMARSFISDGTSVGCQFQAFLIQMFMPADAFWTLAMAINVYLTFYFKFDAERLRKMEMTYLICCYGIPFIPAFTYIFVSNSSGQRVYGDATLWCWVTPAWDIMRIATFYGPVWIVILVTFFIYIRAGRTIYEKRKQLHRFGVGSSSVAEPESDPYSVKTTEVFVTSEVVNTPRGFNNFSVRRDSEASSAPRAPNGAYSVTISSDKRSTINPVTPSQPNAPRPQITQRRKNYELNNAAWSYTKCAILFFTAILITWIPSSANRVYSVVHADETSVVLEYMSALVLPLQGFWNAVIYVTTSWKACRNIVQDISFGRRPKVTELIGRRPDFMRRDENKSYESESMTELRTARTNSNEKPRE